jgi:dienelactone hydrolase
VATPWAVRIPLLLLLAGQDELSSTRACQELVERLGESQPIEVHVYPEARHAFDVPDLPALLPRPGGAIGHDPDATAAAREEVNRFLAR